MVGVLPLFLFNVWAFRNPLHTPYVDYWRENPVFDARRPAALVGLLPELFSSLGLLTLAPVLAAGIAGAVLLYRRGHARRGGRLRRRAVSRSSSTSPGTAPSAGSARRAT